MGCVGGWGGDNHCRMLHMELVFLLLPGKSSLLLILRNLFSESICFPKFIISMEKLKHFPTNTPLR